MSTKPIDQYIDELVNKLYEEFKGTPSAHPIVRNNQIADAFSLAVLKVLYGKKLGLSFNKENCSEIAKYVIAPPDAGIDIFITRENGDDTHYDVIQIKYAKQSKLDIQMAFSYMKDTIDNFCKNPKNVTSETCKEILVNSGLDKNSKKNCQYYIVHLGELHGNITSKDDETVLNLTDLDIIINSLKYKVSQERFSVGKDENSLIFGNPSDDQNAIVFNMNCYELAELNLKYYSTEAGRNILFGSNLREMLNPKKSRSYAGMKKTLTDEPYNFWYYNNGITIVAEDAVLQKNEGYNNIVVSQFSIVNGAQTTSSLGWMLSKAKNDNDQQLINNMKKAYVIARVLKVSDESVKHNIAIYNNTQNPINFRDMVANNIEQRTLHDWLLDESYPQIYVEVRRGANKPQTFNKIYAHRDTTNEALAQLAFAGFYLDPGTAKDKKTAIFNAQDDPDYILNEFYHKIFYLDTTGQKENGILFRKTKYEIDELLFSAQLYKDCKSHLRKSYQDLISEAESQKTNATQEELAWINETISGYQRTLDTIGICMVYFVTAYADMALRFGGNFKANRYDYDKYYSDKAYRTSFVDEASNLFLMETVNVLINTAVDNHKESNMNNWVRSKTCPKQFIDRLKQTILTNPIQYKQRFEAFMSKYKIIPV